MNSPPRAGPARRTDALLAAAATVLAFALYLSNGPTLTSYDSAPNSLVALNLFENRRLDFDRFRAGYFNELGGQYAFTEAPNGHLASAFPIGAAILTLPLYGIFWLAQPHRADLPPINSLAFEPQRRQYEKLAAAAVAAASVGLFLLCAREIGNATQAALATATYALATSLWSIGSQALWQHGPVNLVVLLTLYALLRALRVRSPASRSRWIIAAGTCAGFLPVIRPTALLFSLAALAFVGWTFRDRAAAFSVAALAGAAPGVAWNAGFFHSLVGGYADNARAYVVSASGALRAFAALLVSPSRGIFVFSPVLAFSLLGAARAWGMRDPRARLILLFALASAALVVQYAFFRYWWAGFAYGPRFLTDIVAVAGLLLVYVIPPDPRAYARSGTAALALVAAFTGLFAFSVGVQFAGVNSGAAGSEWNAVPVSIDRDPGRVWQLTDSQIERNVRATYFRFFAWNIARSPSYDRGLAADVRAISPALTHVAARAAVEATAFVRNDGRSPVYGYASGVYVGQLRIRVRIVDARRHTYSEQNLYLAGSPAPGRGANAVGTLEMPSAAGTYLLECAPVLVGGDSSAAGRTAPFRVVLRVS